MGIPKFFRWLSERYPLISQLIQENKIPEFDNLYLDFNSIIHNCSHPNDEDAHFRLSEAQIFAAIFQYVEVLFAKIKPKKLFFMAVDGVAPRAKMNQQRSRRFRTAKEAREVREKALSKGETLPEEKAFDSNAITPGTPFMARLSDQLRYFVNKKISEDADWRNVQVVLSGHEVPGEGEHKIMEYIRLSKAQPDYNPNVRHCLYGLDADLIMLGLLSHDPHFCLLREEVKFGPARKKSSGGIESQNFFLLHLSLLREYLDHEFDSLAGTTTSPSNPQIAPVLRFGYSLERIIDDFILLAIFVGNDFLPHLPDFHIHENGLERLFDIYKKILPKAGGYLVKQGTINLKRLQLILDELAIGEVEAFQKDHSDMNYFQGKQKKYQGKKDTPSGMTMTVSQKEILETVKRFVLDPSSSPGPPTLALVNNFPAGDRVFLKKLAKDLNLFISWDEFDEQGQNLVTLEMPYDDDQEPDEESENDWEDVEGTEGFDAVVRALKKYDQAKLIDEEGTFEEREDKRLKEKMDQWKRGYYKEKLELSYDNPKDIGDLVYRYVEGLQWVMYYYYSGVASWGWFYNYHYAPKISDLKGVDQMSFSYELGRPFKPYEQLMGVLPEASKELIPVAYRDLMYSTESPILDFYPQTFEQDMNGKRAEWEAIVKIPFIDKDRLQSAMRAREPRLTEEEKRRNALGTSTSFTFIADQSSYYKSSLPGFFPDILRCKCKMETFDLPTLDGLHLVEGLCDGVFLGADALAGFPSLKTLPYTSTLGHHQVNVFQSDSRNKSMVINIQNPWEGLKAEELARSLVGERMFTNWPFLQEGTVDAISDNLFRYTKDSKSPHKDVHSWTRKAQRIEDDYSKKRGVITGEVDILLHVRPLKGLRRLEDGALVKEYEDTSKEVDQALQMGVSTVVSEDPRYEERDAPPLSEEFPKGTKVIFLGEGAYGTAAQVSEAKETSLSIVIATFPSERADLEDLASIVDSYAHLGERYYPSFNVANILKINGLALAKITSSLMIRTSDGKQVNLGLSLKFEAKSMKVLNYSRKDGKTWEFSETAVQLIREYRDQFPDLFQSLTRQRDADFNRPSDLFPGVDAELRVKQARDWLKAKGVRDFEPVSLFCAQLDKKTTTALEECQNRITANKNINTIRRVLVDRVPRQSLLKPSHAVYRLQNQVFTLGDRVTMVQESGSVPLSAKGVVIGLNVQTIDILWDQPFMSGSTLGNRCSQYRGSTIPLNACLNLTNQQFVLSTRPQAKPKQLVQHRSGPYPIVQPQGSDQPAAGFRPQQGAPLQILVNPSRNVPARHHGAASKPQGSLVVQPEDHDQQTTLQPTSPGSQISFYTAADSSNGHGRGQPPHRSRGRGRGHGPRGGHVHPVHVIPRGRPHAHVSHNVSEAPQVPLPLPLIRGRGGRGGFRGRRGIGAHNIVPA